MRGTAGALGLSRDRRCRNSWRGINLFSATARQKPIRADPTGASVWGETNTRRANPGMLILAGTFQLPVGQSPGSQEGGPDGLCPLVPSVSCCTPAPPPPTQTRSLREVWAPAPGVLPVCPPQAGPQTHAPPGAFLQPHLPVPSTALDLAPWGLQREHWEDGGLQSELSTGTSPHIREQGTRTRSAPPDAHSDTRTRGQGLDCGPALVQVLGIAGLLSPLPSPGLATSRCSGELTASQWPRCSSDHNAPPRTPPRNKPPAVPRPEPADPPQPLLVPGAVWDVREPCAGPLHAVGSGLAGTSISASTA